MVFHKNGIYIEGFFKNILFVITKFNTEFLNIYLEDLLFDIYGFPNEELYKGEKQT
jgi:hypothetical protein